MTPDAAIAAHAYDPETLQSPWAFDSWLREHAPVYYDAENNIFLVSNYELISEVVLDPARFSSRTMEKFLAKEPFPEEVMEIYAEGYPIVDALLVTDGERHDRHRRIVTKAFSRKRLNDLAPAFDDRIRELLDRALPKGHFKFREEIANAVPLVMTQEQLRISGEDMPRAVGWSEIISSGFGGIPKSLEQLKREAREMIEFQKYFVARISGEIEYLREGGHGEREDDLLVLLARAIVDPSDPMDMAEALSLLFNLFPATHDTTTASLTACMQRFTSSETAQAMAMDSPDCIPQIVEEAMRHEAPIRAFWRRALVDTTLGGVAIPVGSWMLLRVSAASRDETIYPNAAEFDPSRKMAKPHLSFSTGIHTCAGRFYARHIIVAVLSALVKRARNFRFVPGANDFMHIPNILASAYVELEIAFDPVGPADRGVKIQNEQIDRG